MPRIKYVGPHDEVEVPSLGLVCQRGESVEVDASTAKQLTAQPDNWQAVKSKENAK